MNPSPPTATLPSPRFPVALARWLETKAAAWLLAVLLSGLVLGMAFKYAHKIRKPRPDGQQARSAIDRWLPQLLEMRKGVNIAERYQYPNPPIMAVLLLPLTFLDPFTASITWYAVKVVLTAVALAWLFRWVGNCRPADPTRETPAFPAWGIVLTLLLSLRPLLGDLEHGNVNLFILFLVLGALTALHSRRDVLAGVVLALAIACKLTPALFLPYLVWKRAWAALAGSVLGLALFFWPGIVPSLVMGWQQNQDHLTSWYRGMVRPFVVEGNITSEMANQSLPGVIARLATHAPADSEWSERENRFIPTRYANLLDLSAAQARLLAKGFMAGFVLLVFWSCRTPLDRAGGFRLSAEFGLILVGMLLFSERTWKHHCVTLVVPFAVLCYYLSACSPGPGLRAYLIGTLTAVTLLVASTSVGLLPEAWAETAQVYGPYVWANFLLITALVVLLRHKPEARTRRDRPGA